MKLRITSIDMVQFVARMQDWGRGTLARLKQRDWRAWLVVVVLSYAIMEFVRARVDETTTLLLAWLFRGVSWLVSQPMGLGGLALLIFLAVLIGTAFWDSRPKPGPKDVARKQLSEADRRLVQDMRTIWNRHGEPAVSCFQTVLGDAVTNLKKRAYWGVLLDPVIKELSQGVEDMRTAVALDSILSIGEVRDRFNRMYSSYLKAMVWVARLDARGDVKLEGESLKQLQRWRKIHFEFHERLLDLHEVPEHHKTLKIFLNFIDDEAFAAFLRAAETKPTAPLPPEARD